MCKGILHIQIQLIVKHTALFNLVLNTYTITLDLLGVIKNYFYHLQRNLLEKKYPVLSFTTLANVYFYFVLSIG